MISFKKFIRSLKFAGQGLKFVWRENNFKIQTVVSLFVVFFMFYFHLTRLEKVAITLVISTVLVLESLNTIFEYLSDILKPRMHDYIKIIKDIMAAVVLMASIAAIIIGLMIFWPYVFSH